MAHGLTTPWQHLRSLLGKGAAASTDAHLLARFIAERDESAFAELVRRHGPMVHGVCRRILSNSHDADDAYQATLLILSRKPSAIRKPDALSCWLHGVAVRVARRLKRNLLRRQDRAALPQDVPDSASDEVSWRELRRLLDEELLRLPDQFRQPLILCYLEGKTRDEAAEQLGWSVSTFRGRLERGRERLRRRLERRGLTLSAALLATLAARNAEAALPLTTSAASAPAAALATEVMRTMLLCKVKTALLWCVAVLFLSAGVGATAYRGLAVEPREPRATIPPPKATKPSAPPEEDGIVKDYLAHLDSFHWSFTLLPQQEKGQFNAQYELRNVQLNVADVPFEPDAKGPTGKPISGHARITKEQAAKIVALLAKDNFFRDSVADVNRLTPHQGSHVEVWASYHKEGASEPVQRWRTLEWTLQMVKQLAAVRQCVDGDAAKLLDQLLKSLEDERKQWEAAETELLTIQTVEDLDTLRIQNKDGVKNSELPPRRRVALDGVLPFAAWPKDLTDEQQKLRDDGLKLAKQWLDKQQVFFYSSRGPDIGDAVRFSHGPTKVAQDWKGQTPFELYGWGAFDINVLLVQEGYSPLVRDPRSKWDKNTLTCYDSAEQYAMLHQKGIWKDPKFAKRLQTIAEKWDRQKDTKERK